MNVTTIVLADDHGFTLAGKKTTLDQTDDLKVIATVGNGLETFIEAKRWSPNTKFAIVTGNPSPAIFNQLLEAGVDGLFLKNSPPAEICAGIVAIANGQQNISTVAKKVLTEEKASNQMTAREIEVLQCIARGQSNNQIAEHLGVSPKTIDSHRTNLMKKLSVHSAAALLVRAMKDGLIDF